MKRIILLVLLTMYFVLVSTASPAIASKLIGNTFDGVLYDIDSGTGTASNSRSSGIDPLCGIEYINGNELFGLSTFGSIPATSSLFQINIQTGAYTLIGNTGITVTEGGLAYNSMNGLLYGCQASGPDLLYTIDMATGQATTIGSVGSSDLSAISFDNNGNLYGLDTGSNQILTLDPTTGATISSITPNINLSAGGLAGFDNDPLTDILYVGFGTTLYTLNPVNGIFNEIGSTGLSQNLAGIAFIPEPATVALLGLGGLLLHKRK